MSALKQQVGVNHYKDLAIQPVEYINRNGLGYIEGSVIKYVTRHREKNGKQDLEKAIHFLQMLIEMDYPAESDPTVAPHPFAIPPEDKSGVAVRSEPLVYASPLTKQIHHKRLDV